MSQGRGKDPGRPSLLQADRRTHVLETAVPAGAAGVSVVKQPGAVAHGDGLPFGLAVQTPGGQKTGKLGLFQG